MRALEYRLKIRRLPFFREWMTGRALRRRPIDFRQTRPVVAIIGDYISDKIRAEGIYERAILEFLRDRILDLKTTKQQVAIDVGANIGNHSLFLSDLFDRVIAFEPNPLTSALLRINIDLNSITNVDIKLVGLSDQRDKACLVFNPTNLGAATSLMPKGTGETFGSAEFELAVGDEIINRSDPIGFIKIDVEGTEDRVLRGLENTIKTHRPIVMIEQWPDVIDAVRGDSPSFTFLRGIGYTAWEFQTRRQFRTKAGKLSTLFFGHTDYYARPLTRLEQREYQALFFIPPSYDLRCSMS